MRSLLLSQLTSVAWVLFYSFLVRKAYCLDYTDAQKEEFVKAHNHYRSKANPKPTTPLNLLKWDKDLETRSKDSLCKNGCSWKHTSNKVLAGRGENLCMYGWMPGSPEPTESASPVFCVKLWYDEKQDYNHQDDTCAAGKVCGHYLQLMWAPATAIGCAKCKTTTVNNGKTFDEVIVMCQYDKIRMMGEPFYKYDKSAACGTCPLSDALPRDQRAGPGIDASTVQGKDAGACGAGSHPGVASSTVTLLLLVVAKAVTSSWWLL